jgi:hypothetical protein
MTDSEAIERENKGSSLGKFARLRQSAVVEGVNLKVALGLDKTTLFGKVAAGDWIERHQNCRSSRRPALARVLSPVRLATRLVAWGRRLTLRAGETRPEIKSKPPLG